ncbi:MAG: hypothetical protein MJ071_00300 [Oscillospiraceae bacterium]|nr:hypothetical protein [Oscillospiraceae bacterium]
MKGRLRYIFLSTLVAFVIWLAGQLILILKFPDSSLLVSQIWVIAVLAAAGAWNLRHFYRAAKKKREDEENENYKGVY